MIETLLTATVPASVLSFLTYIFTRKKYIVDANASQNEAYKTAFESYKIVIEDLKVQIEGNRKEIECLKNQVLTYQNKIKTMEICLLRNNIVYDAE